MAERRMFSKTVIDSDCFLDMPLTAQALYFHLAMRADDDGFVNNPKSIMRNVCCKDDDLKMLIAKKYIIAFESGIVVITHWKIHNYIRKDRYSPTKNQEEMEQITLQKDGRYTIGITSDSQRLTDGCHRLGEDSLGKVSSELEKDSSAPSHPKKPKSSDINSLKKYGKYKNVQLTESQYSSLVKDFGENKTDEYIKKVDEYCQQNGKHYNDYDLTIRKWLSEDKNKQPEHSYDLDEFNDYTLNCVPKIQSEQKYGNYI